MLLGHRPHLRGGTPAVRLGGDYLAFMHVVQQHAGRSLYRVAAYTFAAKPPFALSSISPPFLLAGRGTPYPIGLVATKRHLLLSYGADDAEWCASTAPRPSARVAAPLMPATSRPTSAHDHNLHPCSHLPLPTRLGMSHGSIARRSSAPSGRSPQRLSLSPRQRRAPHCRGASTSFRACQRRSASGWRLALSPRARKSIRRATSSFVRRSRRARQSRTGES